MGKVEIEETELQTLRLKAKDWDNLGEKIGTMYGHEDENGDWVENNGDEDLCDIGELAAAAYGYL